MVRWKALQVFYAIAVLLGACVMASCADSKETTTSSFDMSEYRKSDGAAEKRASGVGQY